MLRIFLKRLFCGHLRWVPDNPHEHGLVLWASLVNGKDYRCAHCGTKRVFHHEPINYVGPGA